MRLFICIYADRYKGKGLCTTLAFYTCINICKDTYIDIGGDLCG